MVDPVDGGDVAVRIQRNLHADDLYAERLVKIEPVIDSRADRVNLRIRKPRPVDGRMQLLLRALGFVRSAPANVRRQKKSGSDDQYDAQLRYPMPFTCYGRRGRRGLWTPPAPLCHGCLRR